MKHNTIVDTGPLVALLTRSDTWHDWTKQQFETVAAPLITCEPVVTEAVYLLSRTQGGVRALLALLGRGVIEVRFSLQTEIEAIERLMRRYASVPMSLADACLVRMSELHSASTVLTLDSDFSIYRRNGRQIILIAAPRAN